MTDESGGSVLEVASCNATAAYTTGFTGAKSDRVTRLAVKPSVSWRVLVWGVTRMAPAGREQRRPPDRKEPLPLMAGALSCRAAAFVRARRGPSGSPPRPAPATTRKASPRAASPGHFSRR
jgi:hypothetical protein